MKKGLLVILILLIAISSVYSYEELGPGYFLIYNDTLIDGQIISVEGNDLGVQINPTYQTVVSYAQYTAILNPYECTEITPYEFCLFNVSTDDQGNLFAETQIATITGAISIQRTFNTLESLVGEPIEATVTLKNVGYRIVSNLSFIDEYPPYIHILDSEVLFSGNKTYWNNGLTVGSVKEIKYSFYSTNSSEFEQQSNVTFYDGYQKIQTNSSIEEFSFNNSVTTAEQNETIFVDELSEINITIFNDYKDDISLELLIVLSDGLAPVSVGDLDPDGNELTWDEMIDEGESVTFPISFKGTHEGMQNITIYYDELKYRTVTFSGKQNFIEIDVDLNEIELITNLDSTETVKEGLSQQVIVVANNPNPSTLFKNIYFSAVLGNLTLSEQEVSSITGGNEAEVSFTFTIPDIIKEETKKLNLSFEYETSYGDKLYTDEIITMYLKADDGITIQKILSNKSFLGGETLVINVTVVNNRGIDLEEVLIEETIPKDFKLIRGLTKKWVEMTDGETIAIYSYELKVPTVDYNTEYTFVTSAIDDIDSHLTTYTKQDTVSLKGILGDKPPEPIIESNSSEITNKSEANTNNTETLINNEDENNSNSNNQESLENNNSDNNSSNGGVLMLFVFWIPLVILVILIIGFFVFVKMGFIILKLPKIQLIPQQTEQGAQVQVQPQMPVQPQTGQVTQQTEQQYTIPAGQVQQVDPTAQVQPVQQAEQPQEHAAHTQEPVQQPVEQAEQPTQQNQEQTAPVEPTAQAPETPADPVSQATETQDKHSEQAQTLSEKPTTQIIAENLAKQAQADEPAPITDDSGEPPKP